MAAWLARRCKALGSRFWVIPTLCCVAALTSGLVLPELDELVGDEVTFLFTGGPAGARSLLSAITTSMISVTGLVFSITVVVLQLASSQFSPRVLRTFLKSRVTQWTLGVFTATFLYSIVVLRSVRGGDGTEPFVPPLAVTGAVVLVVASVGLFLAYIQHITQAIRVSTIVGNVGAETSEVIDRLRGDGEVAAGPTAVTPGPRTGTVCSTGSGVVTRLATGPLVRQAERGGVVLALLVQVGQFVARGMPVVAVHDGPVGEFDEDAVRAAVHLARDRDMDADIAFGLRQLVDIAERALSPGINDPTTAVQALDQIHGILRRLATLPDASTVRLGKAGEPRLLLREPRFTDYLDLALDEILQYGHDALPVQERTDELLADLHLAARPEHRAAVAAKRRLLTGDAGPPAG